VSWLLCHKRVSHAAEEPGWCWAGVCKRADEQASRHGVRLRCAPLQPGSTLRPAVPAQQAQQGICHTVYRCCVVDHHCSVGSTQPQHWLYMSTCAAFCMHKLGHVQHWLYMSTCAAFCMHKLCPAGAAVWLTAGGMHSRARCMTPAGVLAAACTPAHLYVLCTCTLVVVPPAAPDTSRCMYLPRHLPATLVQHACPRVGGWEGFGQGRFCHRVLQGRFGSQSFAGLQPPGGAAM
jgi:hypothetical protein